MSNKLIWFRQDLRITDNTALSIAAEDSQSSLYALYIATPGQWREHDMAPAREDFILQHVASLEDSLSQLNIPLIYIQTDNFSDIPVIFSKLLKKYNFSAVYANHEYGWNEKKRDSEVHNILEDKSCDLHLFHDQGMLPPGLTTKAGKPYSVFTPFKKAWLQEWRAVRPFLHGKPKPRIIKTELLESNKANIPLAADPLRWKIGESAAIRALNCFCQQRIIDYKIQRDIPAIDGTSSLSPWLSAGALSPRSCLDIALEANNGRLTGGYEGVDTWINELIWRDFYIHILDSFPQVSRNQPFKIKTKSIKWRENTKDFKAWCEGNTGIPIVDAAMRQLVQTGWMHNRLRMIVAMFLSKQLLIDWRLGERFFMEHLIDGHLASNNGGWQWAATTGTDSVPYFRIFNPVTQSKRFDPSGEFIKKFVPELSNVSGKDIHFPNDSVRALNAPDYPEPIVDLKLGRARALNVYSSL